jgi:hypothetical protein
MLYDITVPQFKKMLNNLSAILDKSAQFATTKKFDMDVLFTDRLAPDQFPLMKQIQITTDTAKLCVSRLTGKDGPKHDDAEKSLTEAKQRIQDVIAYLSSVSAADFKDAEEKRISQPRWEAKYLYATEYVLQHAIPNFYFHLTTSYAILRANGVDIGKADYLGAMPFKS